MTDINIMIYDRSLENLACIYGVIFIETHMGRQKLKATAKIISLYFTYRFTEKLILFLKKFLCRIPSEHS